MRAYLRPLLLAVLVVVLGAVLWRNEGRRRTPVLRPAAAVPPPRALSVVLSPEHDFTLHGADGQALRLAAWQDRSPLVLSFFATDCHTCAQELPYLREMYEAHRDQGLKMVLVCRESPARLKRFLAANALPFPVVLDRRQRLHETYAVPGTPFTMLIGRDGRVVGAPFSFYDGSQFKAEFVPRVVAVCKSGNTAGI